MTIIFARSRHVYDSYLDFWQLVELSGFPVCHVDECDLTQDVVYVTSLVNREWDALIQAYEGRPRRAHLILWNLERPDGWAGGSVGSYGLRCWRMLHQRHFDEIWVSDRRLASETELRFVVLGSHPGLGTPGIVEKQYDFCHMSVKTNRRQSIYKHFDNIGPNCWPPQRDAVLKASRFALNVHQDRHPFQEPLRFALFAAYGLPILTEDIYDSFPWGTSTMFYSPYPGIVRRMKDLLKEDYDKCARVGLRAHHLMCEDLTFGKCVRQAVKESLER